MSRRKPPRPLQLLLGTAEGTTVKPFPEYLKENFRKAFWEATIFWWGLIAILLMATVILIAVNGEYYAALAILAGGIPIGILFGAMAGAQLARSIVHGHWMRDLGDEELDRLDALDALKDGEKDRPA